jgi:hypothetical protein
VLGEVAEARPRTEGAVPSNVARARPPYPSGFAAAVLSPQRRPSGSWGDQHDARGGRFRFLPSRVERGTGAGSSVMR